MKTATIRGSESEKPPALLKEIRECVQTEGIPLEIALKGITSNPASILKLGAKGRLQPGFDADLCLLTADHAGAGHCDRKRPVHGPAWKAESIRHLRSRRSITSASLQTAERLRRRSPLITA